MVKLKNKMSYKELYSRSRIDLCIECLFAKKQALFYLDKFLYYRDSLNLVKYYLKEHKHVIDDDIYNQLMFYVERKFDNEIPVKSDKIWF